MVFKNKKSLGQNFLIDNNILNKIVKIGDLSKNDSVLEIGAGSGNLTRFILNEVPKNFIVVEKDIELVNVLKKKFNNQIKIVHSDILNLKDDFYSEKFIVYGNLPYNISTKILSNWCLTNKIMFKKLILMFQKEVADRIIAKENTKEYGRITILANWKFNIKKVFDVSPECFFPRPKIKSTLLEFIPKKNQVHINDPKNLEKITRIFFSQRRKMVKKNFIKLFKNFDFISEKINIKLTDRPQTISTNKFLMIVKEYENSLN